jgi:hypothetical protein
MFKIKKTTVFFLMFILFGCSNPAKEAETYIVNEADNYLMEDIQFLNNTAELMTNIISGNYWYTEEYTFQDILLDKYQIGYRGLKMLENDLNMISSNDVEVLKAKELVKKEIIIALKKIRELQVGIESINELNFFGGINGILAISRGSSSKEEQMATEKKGREIPENVKIQLEKFTELMLGKYKEMTHQMHNLEKSAFHNKDLKLEEKLKIRYKLKLIIKERIRIYSNPLDDTSSTDYFVKELFNLYDKEFSVK